MTQTPSPQHLQGLLSSCARTSNGILLYGSPHSQPEQLSYANLQKEAAQAAARLLRVGGTNHRQIVLVHLPSHRDNIVWFWASILANLVPTMSTPLTGNPSGRLAHLQHLQRLLQDPLVITTRQAVSNELCDCPTLRTFCVDGAENFIPTMALTTPFKKPSQGPLELLAAMIPPTPPSSEHGSSTPRYLPSTAAQTIFAHAFPPSSPPRELALTAPSTSLSSSVPSIDGSLESLPDLPSPDTPTKQQEDSLSLDHLAALMLTSGSTGSAKAVCLTHTQMIASCQGKLAHLPMEPDGVFLNWIELDHVGSLVEMHLAAMLANLDQVHVKTSEIVADPLAFLQLLSKHKVSRTFAPNFFLKALQRALDTSPKEATNGLELSALRYLISGGEANSVENCVAITRHLHNLGAPKDAIITPGFGMTETCAGSIYSRSCPAADCEAETEFAALGTCVPGISMRVSGDGSSGPEGDLEVSGPIVFSRYYNNVEATAEAFTDDGWFRTGDRARIDKGVLRLVGRSKDVININGVKHLPHELEAVIEQENIPGIARSSVVCFATREKNSATEQVFVVYQHTYPLLDAQSRWQTLQGIIKMVTSFTGSRPEVLPLPEGQLERTTLGKISRGKVRDAVTTGKYIEHFQTDSQMLKQIETERSSGVKSEAEAKLIQVLRGLDLAAPDIGTHTPLLNMGVTSVDLIRIKRAAQESFGIGDIPLITVVTNTTVSSLATAIEHLGVTREREYDPVVVLQPRGSQTPLWLMHPGIGEMLVFLGLVQFFPDRPLYAMRARGLNEGEKPYSGLQEVVTSYYLAIKARQSKGPYAIAGYSYGSMLAFEIAKLIETDGETVQFLGSFNLPPFIRLRMRRLDWTAGLTHIAHFCSIITEERSEVLAPELRSLPYEEQVTRLLAESDQSRCDELALTHATLLNWTHVSWSLQKIGWDYDPSGSVSHLDVFYCQPLKDVAGSREEYRKDHLNHWVGFIRDDLKFWEVAGKHYTMIGPDHVVEFQRTLKRALTERGL